MRLRTNRNEERRSMLRWRKVDAVVFAAESAAAIEV